MFPENICECPSQEFGKLAAKNDQNAKCERNVFWLMLGVVQLFTLLPLFGLGTIS